MDKTIELLAPGGDIDSIKAAILAGADAVYCGLDKFNARNRADNITFEALNGILHLAHQHNCEVFLTLNILIVENEIQAIISLLNKLVNTSIDGVIIQDIGLCYLLSKHFKTLKIHASTQLTTHNAGQIKFLHQLNATRVNLSRELNLHEIEELTTEARNNKLLTEVFVHGSNCISFSGQCYISSVVSGNSGNRGRCSQPCRDKYTTTKQGVDYPLNMKDNSAYLNMQELVDAGVYSLKIEGRIKKADYVYTVVHEYKKQLHKIVHKEPISKDNSTLYKVFNRDFSNGYITGAISSNMFIDNPRDHSIKHISETNTFFSADALEQAHLKLYNEKEQLKTFVYEKTSPLNANREVVDIHISGNEGTPLKVKVQSSEFAFTVVSNKLLTQKGNQPLDETILLTRLKAINETEYVIGKINSESLNKKLYLPFSELTSIKKKILVKLNNGRPETAPVKLTPPTRHQNKSATALSLFISNSEQLEGSDTVNTDIYYELPNNIAGKYNQLIETFSQHKTFIPWFPSILIGDDYSAAIQFLKEVKPHHIVTNNSGIAFEAFQMGISWIAGPHLNAVNSYTLLSLKEQFNCSGAFISNELSKDQIRAIRKPENFTLHFSIFHPIELMISRQCFFHQVTGCHKTNMDENCLTECAKSASIKTEKNNSFLLHKTEGNYNRLFHEKHLLNTDIIKDLPHHFTSFLVDIRNTTTHTHIHFKTPDLIKQFKNLLMNEEESKEVIIQNITPTFNEQYYKGI